MKNMRLQHTAADTYDLLIERSSGEEVSILMPRKKKKDCKSEWERLRQLCDDVIELLSE